MIHEDERERMGKEHLKRKSRICMWEREERRGAGRGFIIHDMWEKKRRRR
jgi:hypothetical protein